MVATAEEKFKERTQAELAQDLDAKIPRDAVSTRDGGGGRKLSYVAYWYVVDRMNKIFGHLNWSNETVELREVPGGNKPTYIARVRVAVHLANGRTVFKDGVGYGSDKSGVNPHEMAAKEAESDAFKRAAKNFGLSFGLALYSKDEDMIDDGEDKPAAAKGPKPTPSATVAPKAEPVPAQSANSGSKEEERKLLNELIGDTSKVVVSRRIKTATELKKYMADTFGIESKEKLSDEQAQQLLTYLKSIL